MPQDRCVNMNCNFVNKCRKKYTNNTENANLKFVDDGNMKSNLKKGYEKLASLLKSNLITPDGRVDDAVKNYVNDKMLPKNVSTYYEIFKVFKLLTLSELAAAYIQCWFTTVAETDNFLVLDFVSLKKILSSSELRITSEIQVLNAALIWMNHDLCRRKKHARDILMTVRTHLLSEIALDEKLAEVGGKCEALMHQVLKHNETSFRNKKGNDFTIKKPGTRCFNKNNFDILLCGNYLTFYCKQKDVFDKIDGDNMLSSISLQSLPKNSHFNIRCSSVINLKGDVYLFNCFNSIHNSFRPVQKYSVVNDSFETVGNMNFDLSNHCACGFIDEIYLIGGYLQDEPTANCMFFDTNDYTWNYVASMKETRLRAACAVFEERIVVSVGYNNSGTLKTVEAFDHMKYEWTYMPSMIKAKFCHRLVAVKNKLFAVERKLVEMYDSTCELFVAIAQPNWYEHETFGSVYITNVVFIENKLIVFCDSIPKVLIYYVDKDEWMISPCCKTYEFSTKIPKLTL